MYIFCFVRKSDLFTTSYILYIQVRFFMLLCYILFITGTPTIPASETSSSIIAGAATGGSIAGIIAVLVPIIAGLIYYRRRKMKSSVRHERYVFPNLNCCVGSYIVVKDIDLPENVQLGDKLTSVYRGSQFIGSVSNCVIGKTIEIS